MSVQRAQYICVFLSETFQGNTTLSLGQIQNSNCTAYFVMQIFVV